MNTCRVCHKANFETTEGLVRYSTRHWVHYSCGIEKWGVFNFLKKLTDTQIATIPNGLVERNPALKAALIHWEEQ